MGGSNPYIEEVKSSLQQLESEEITRRVQEGKFTEVAHAIAIDVLQGRNVDTLGLPTAPVPQTQVKQSSGFLSRCLSGKVELWKAFWLLGWFGGLAMIPVNVAARNVAPVVLARVERAHARGLEGREYDVTQALFDERVERRVVARGLG